MSKRNDYGFISKVISKDGRGFHGPDDWKDHAIPIVFGVIVLLAIMTALMAFWPQPAHAEGQTLTASWYSVDSLKKEGTWKHGEQRMANGKRFDEKALSCGTRLYPLGTMLKIINLKNGKAVNVVVTDRIGKRFATSRIDLTKQAFEKIALLKAGLVSISAEVIHV